MFVSQSFSHHYWVSLKMEAVSLLAHFSFTGLSSHPVCLSDIAGLIQQQHSGWIVLTNSLRKSFVFLTFCSQGVVLSILRYLDGFLTF